VNPWIGVLVGVVLVGFALSVGFVSEQGGHVVSRRDMQALGDNELATAGPVSAQPDPEGGYRAVFVVAEQGANVRVRPSATAAVLRSVGHGQQVIVGEEHNGWRRIARIGDTTIFEGWVWGELLKRDPPQNGARLDQAESLASSTRDPASESNRALQSANGVSIADSTVPNISALSEYERRTIELACFSAKGGGSATYNTCLVQVEPAPKHG
jgi:hypothetical protein